MGLRYIGKGFALLGIPARDLTSEEVEIYGGEKKLLASKLYAPQREEKVEKPPSQNQAKLGGYEKK